MCPVIRSSVDFRRKSLKYVPDKVISYMKERMEFTEKEGSLTMADYDFAKN